MQTEQLHRMLMPLLLKVEKKRERDVKNIAVQ
jgi:hypothetical protein